MEPPSDQEVVVVNSPTTNHDEVRWTDDSIRWKGGLRVDTSSSSSYVDEVGADDKKPATAQEKSEEEDNDDEDYVIDPFKDPNPFEMFSFQFQLPEHPLDDDDNSNNNNETPKENRSSALNIHIRGYKTDADEVWQSTGLTLWRASHYLCQYQLEHHRKLFLSNKRTLELGAGLGLNGILAWKLTELLGNNSSQVCITDGDSDALVQLRANVNRNRSSVSERIVEDDQDDRGKVVVSCHQLIWGKESAAEFLMRIAKNEKYDIILASDVIYSLVIVEPLWQTVELLLKKEVGKFVMAYARREVPVSIELVLKASIEHGFTYELVKEDTIDGIWVYEFRH